MTLRLFSRISLRWKLPIVVCGLLLCVTAIQLWTAYLRVRQSAEQAAEERLPRVAGEIADALAPTSHQLAKRARTIATDSAIGDYFMHPTPQGLAAASQLIRHATPGDSNVYAVEFLDATGARIATDAEPQMAGAHLGSEDLPQYTHNADSAGVGRIQAVGDTLVVPIVSAVTTDKEHTGYLVVWRRLNENRGGKSKNDSKSKIATLLGSDATLYLGSPNGAWTDQVSVVPAPPVDLAKARGVLHYVRPGVGPRVASAVAVAGMPWVVLVEFSTSVVLAPATHFLVQSAWIALAVLVAGLIVAWLFSSHLAKPLLDLTAAADAMGAGDHRPIHVAAHGDDEVGRLGAAFNRMAARVTDEVAARMRSEDQWRLLFDNNPHPMWVYELQSLRILAVNEAAVRRYGWSRNEFLEMNLKDLRPPEDVPALLQHISQLDLTEENNSSWRHRRKDGTIIDVEASSHTLAFNGEQARLVLAQDVTARKTLEEQLRQSQKMEAIGRLAGGVAHDFNNVLAVVTTLADLMQMDLAEDHPSRNDLDTMLRAAQQGHALTRQLLAFSRQQVLQPIVLDPNGSVAEVEKMLRRTIGEDIELSVNLMPSVGDVRADPGQLQQVLLNLAVNARDAMPAGGKLTITTTRADVDESSRALHGLETTGKFVVISVTDTGSGMTPEVRDRIFEPFFTTKHVGKGTGLGLSIVYGIVTQSGGSITVYSEPGQGSTFRVYIPMVASDGARLKPATVHRFPRGSETILLVEDDPLVRSAAGETLKRLGYTILVADSGDAALELIDAHGDGVIDLVVSDVVMPRMDGPTLVSQLRLRRPDLKAVLMSGYPGGSIADRVVPTDVGFLDKPFSVSALANKVREVLDGAEAEQGVA